MEGGIAIAARPRRALQDIEVRRKLGVGRAGTDPIRRCGNIAVHKHSSPAAQDIVPIAGTAGDRCQETPILCPGSMFYFVSDVDLALFCWI